MNNRLRVKFSVKKIWKMKLMRMIKFPIMTMKNNISFKMSLRVMMIMKITNKLMNLHHTQDHLAYQKKKS